MFDLNEDRKRQFIFAMENQKRRYVVDVSSGALRREDGLEPGEIPDTRRIDPSAPYVALPEWSSADGYQLMESFAVTVEDRDLQTELRNVLASGESVFRRFKEALRNYPGAEMRWNRFRLERHGNALAEWYNRIRELAGLEAVEVGVDEETEDLVRDDFSIQRVVVADSNVAAPLAQLDESIAREITASLPTRIAERLRADRARFVAQITEWNGVKFAARSPREEECGVAWLAQTGADSDGAYSVLALLYVSPPFRGLGIANALADAVIGAVGDSGFLVVETAGDSPELRHRFERELEGRLVWNCWRPRRAQSGELSS